MHLRLMINNTDDLSGGYSAIKDFDEQGGTIGSSVGSNWQIVDRHGSIADIHAAIYLIDGQFCLETALKKGVKINKAKSFIPAGEPVQLTDGDILKVGRFELTAFVEMPLDETEKLEKRDRKWTDRFVSVSSLIDPDEGEGVNEQNFLDHKRLSTIDEISMRVAKKHTRDVDPVNLIEEAYQSRSTNEVDPVKLFERDAQAERNIMVSKLGDIINVEPEETGKTDIPDDLQPGSAYMDMPKIESATPDRKKSGKAAKPETGNDMDSYLATLANSARTPAEARQGNVGDIITRDRYLGDVDIEDGGEDKFIDHILLRPLCIALGLPVQKMSEPQANRLMHDIGEALKAAISGLMATHQQTLSDKSHRAETHLHAIEDNPLRLGKDADSVIADLFLVKSPVHLSAAAAIEESLELLQYHEQANETAVNEALDSVLRALGPLSLAKRFRKYKGHAPRAGDLDAWHWQMYQHYYNEIRSAQQGGLSRMFWEVYRQVYDREMREQSLEG